MGLHFWETKKTNIALVSMPWAPYESPSMAIGLLKSVFIEHGYRCQAFYSSIRFYRVLQKHLEGIIERRIDEITASTYSQLNDWLFARKAFGVEGDGFLETYSEDPVYLKVREDFELIIDEISQQPHWMEFDLIGFTCGFNQTVSSLAIAKAIKRCHPSVSIVFGGRSLDQEISEQIFKNTNYVDAIIVGEAELSFPQAIPGILQGEVKFISSPPLSTEEYNCQPLPNYDEFFEESNSVCCSMEASRGCWYKPLCSFCGMVPEGPYRQKKDMLPEIVYLKNRYSITEIQFGDLVFPTAGLRLFEQTSDLGIDFMYNLRVDSIKPRNIQQLKSMKEGGTKSVFIGIESLHPKLLTMTNKGQTAINAISLLKWMKFYDIRLDWYLLFGIPGEQPDHYNELLSTLKKITHFHAPSTQSIVVSRNSPYFYQFQNELEPIKSCQYIYPPAFNARTMSWIYDRINLEHMKNQISNATVIRTVVDFLRSWKRSNEGSLIQVGHTVIDTRLGSVSKYDLSKAEINLVDYCAVPQKQEDVQCNFDQEKIQRMIQNNLIVHLDQQYLTLIEPQTELTCDIRQNGVNQKPCRVVEEMPIHVPDDTLSLIVL